MSWNIDKQFDFCYSHRVYVQKLNKEFCASGDYNTKCRHIHGHQGKVHVFVEADNLDERSMVIDFKEMGFLKDFIDDYLDHKFIIDIRDPMFQTLVHRPFTELTGEISLPTKTVKVPGTKHVAGRVIDLSSAKNLSDASAYEVLEGYFIVDFVPTSEKLAHWMYNIAQSKLDGLGATVSRIDWFETPKSRSSFCP